MKYFTLFNTLLFVITIRLFSADLVDTPPMPDSKTILQTLQTGHPRLYIQPGIIEKIKLERQNDLFLAEMCDRLVQNAGAMLEEQPVD